MTLKVSEEFVTREGAEARISVVDWNGMKAISKKRIPKKYRDQSLDLMLRTRRTKQEAEMLHSAKLAGVRSPFIHYADPVNSELIMEYVEGRLLKDLSADEDSAKWYELLGEYTARLHAYGIMHGDLTTKNVIISSDNLILIDFGLSFFSDRLEDRGEDLHLLKQAVRSSCSPKLATTFFSSVMKGYSSCAGKVKTEEVQAQIIEIEKRGRYARVD